MMFMYGSSMSTPRISERRTYRRNLFTAAEGRRAAVYVLFTCFGREKEENKDVVSGLPKHDCLLGESFMRCGQVQDAVRL